jgi:hypothetical protein
MKNRTDKIQAMFALALAVLVSGLLPASAADTKPARSFAALEKAEHIKLSVVRYEGLPLSEVIINLHDESVRRDSAHKGVKITLAANAEAKAYTVIKLDLKDVTLAKALERVAQCAGLRLQATDTELLLVLRAAKP